MRETKVLSFHSICGISYYKRKSFCRFFLKYFGESEESKARKNINKTRTFDLKYSAWHSDNLWYCVCIFFPFIHSRPFFFKSRSLSTFFFFSSPSTSKILLCEVTLYCDRGHDGKIFWILPNYTFNVNLKKEARVSWIKFEKLFCYASSPISKTRHKTFSLSSEM